MMTDITICPFYESWEEEWQGSFGPQGATIPGGEGCHIAVIKPMTCGGDPDRCPLADNSDVHVVIKGKCKYMNEKKQQCCFFVSWKDESVGPHGAVMKSGSGCHIASLALESPSCGGDLSKCPIADNPAVQVIIDKL